MRVCPRCGSPIQRIVHTGRETNYCPTCQTGGKLLADRALSQLLKKDWPKTLEELEDLKNRWETRREGLVRYAATIFLSAFLLFQVQPLAAKAILPWFGGSPSVWTTCMLFFQVLLLGGYCYAHVLASRFDARMQAIVHTLLLLAALAALPILPDVSWKPDGSANPVGRILLLLTVNLGLPYFLLSSTGPLVQRWFSLARPGRSPYRLYALSNIGSIVALLSFPFLFEPVLTTQVLGTIWSVGFGAFVLLCAAAVWTTVRTAPVDATARGAAQERERVPATRLGAWLGLAALPSVMLLAVTNLLCQDIAVVPFLWIAPLTAYLLTFILCFDSDRWYRRGLFAPLLAVVAPLSLVVTYLVERNIHIGLTSLGAQVAIHSTLLFLCGMVCHGELARSRPGTSRLTLFYVCVSAGGALGGVFVALVAPVIFDSYVELWLGAAACTVVAGVALAKAGASWVKWAAIPTMTAIVAGAVTLHIALRDPEIISAERGFFGRLRVREQLVRGPKGTTTARGLSHGHTLHGLQIMDPGRRRTPTAYFTHRAGVGVAIGFVREVVARRRKGPVKIGIVGLGAGTLATYAARGDEFRFYEIQPEVIQAAEEHFTFLPDARKRGARVATILGDARIQLERELENGGHAFDLLVVDAFSSDAIPKHLLTKECNAVYWKHLTPDGLLAIHITNRYLDLLPVVKGLAKDANRSWVRIEVAASKDRLRRASVWTVITNNSTFLNAQGVKRVASVPVKQAAALLWTDDFSSLWHVLK